jgi:GTPase SAR1 family protein
LIIGQDKYKSFTKLYLRGATGCIIVADITKDETVLSVLSWHSIVSKFFEDEGTPNIPFVLFLNKVDLIPKLIEKKDNQMPSTIIDAHIITPDEKRYGKKDNMDPDLKIKPNLNNNSNQNKDLVEENSSMENSRKIIENDKKYCKMNSNDFSPISLPNVLEILKKDPNYLGFLETSAKENTNLKEGIGDLVNEIINRRKDEKKEDEGRVSEGRRLQGWDERSNDGCCKG